MIRTQIQLTQDQMRALRARASRQNLSVAELIRRAVDAFLGSETAPTPEERRRRALKAAGRFASGASNVAERHDDYLSEAYRT